jgi:hypothetical protein
VSEATAEELPPVPEQDPGGDQRIGWWITGILCVLVGWAGAIATNLVLHRLAPTGGWRIGGIWIGSAMGPYAWTILGIGAAVGGFGVVLFHLARQSPRGPFVLPGHAY